jgi:hypothetical protein
VWKKNKNIGDVFSSESGRLRRQTGAEEKTFNKKKMVSGTEENTFKKLRWKKVQVGVKTKIAPLKWRNARRARVYFALMPTGSRLLNRRSKK